MIFKMISETILLYLVLGLALSECREWPREWLPRPLSIM